MSETLYKKVQVGKRWKYVPVAEYDTDQFWTFVKGDYLISVRPGSGITRQQVNPDYKRVRAALIDARELLINSLRDSWQAQPESRQWNNKEKAIIDACYDALRKMRSRAEPVGFIESLNGAVDNAIKVLGYA